jgi:negative regulator of flagellin synthesis FlgM
MSMSYANANSLGAYQMKIEELNQKQMVSRLVSARTEKSESADVHGETSYKSNTTSDKVELSSYLPAGSVDDTQGSRVARVAQLKSQIASGGYQVPGTAVAEKMLSKIVLSSSATA